MAADVQTDKSRQSLFGSKPCGKLCGMLCKKYDVDVMLICCADGGTVLSQRMPGTLLYDNAVAQASKARAADIRHCRDFMASVRDRLQPGAICFVFAPAEYYA